MAVIVQFPVHLTRAPGCPHTIDPEHLEDWCIECDRCGGASWHVVADGTIECSNPDCGSVVDIRTAFEALGWALGIQPPDAPA